MAETAMVRIPAREETVLFTPEQRQMIRDVYAAGATESEFAVFMEVARARKLNPLTKQIYIVKRWNSELNRNVWTPQTGIDGLRAIAERTGLYDGQDDAEFEYGADGKSIKFARVRVYKKGIQRPFVGTAHWGEYAQTKKDGSLTNFWATKPHVMIAKCAEALALRKAFPEDMSGLYTDDELPAAEEREINSKPALRGMVPDEPPHDAVTGEVLGPDEATKKLATELVIACDHGFNAQQHKDNWIKKHWDEIAGLKEKHPDLYKTIKDAYDKAHVGVNGAATVQQEGATA